MAGVFEQHRRDRLRPGSHRRGRSAYATRCELAPSGMRSDCFASATSGARAWTGRSEDALAPLGPRGDAGGLNPARDASPNRSYAARRRPAARAADDVCVVCGRSQDAAFTRCCIGRRRLRRRAISTPVDALAQSVDAARPGRPTTVRSVSRRRLAEVASRSRPVIDESAEIFERGGSHSDLLAPLVPT